MIICRDIDLTDSIIIIIIKIIIIIIAQQLIEEDELDLLLQLRQQIEPLHGVVRQVIHLHLV